MDNYEVAAIVKKHYMDIIGRIFRYKPNDFYRKGAEYIRDRLDEICSLTVRIRDNFTSVLSHVSQKRTTVQCGHILERNLFPTRWEERNLATITAGQNYEQEHSPTKYRILWTSWLGGPDEYEKLVAMAFNPRKMTMEEKVMRYRLWRGRLRAELDRIGIKIITKEENA